MAVNADGNIVINFEFPINKIRQDKQVVDQLLKSIGKDAGDEYQKSFNKNADEVKSKAHQTSKEVNDELGKGVKSKVDLNTNEAKNKLNQAKKSFNEIKDVKSKLAIDTNGADHKVKETNNYFDKLKNSIVKPTDFKIKTTQADNNIKNTDKQVKDLKNDTASVGKSAGSFTLNPFKRLKNQITSVDDKAKDTHKTFKSMFMGSFLGSAVSSGLSAVGSKLHGMYTEGMNLNMVTSKLVARFHGMGLSARQIGVLTNQIKELKTYTNMSGEDVADLQTKMLNWSRIGFSGATRMAKAIGAIGDSSKLDGQQMAQLGAGLMRVGSTGKVTLGSLSRITRFAPTFYAQLAKGAGMSEGHLKSLLSTGKVTAKQFQTWLANSSKYAGTAFKGFTQTQGGALKEMKVSWQTLEQTMTKPIFDAKTSGLQALKDILASPEVVGAAKSIGTGISNALGFVDKHKSDITGTARDVAKIALTLGKDVWKDFSSIILDIAKSFGLVNINSKNSGDSLHQFRLFMDNLAKNKGAIEAVSRAILAFAAFKGLKTVGGGLMDIAQGSYKVLHNTHSLFQGLRGIGDITKLDKTAQGFYSVGSAVGKLRHPIQLLQNGWDKALIHFVNGRDRVVKVFSAIGRGFSKIHDVGRTVFKALGKVGSTVWSGIKTASSKFASSFVNQIKLIGKGIKGLGRGALNATKWIGGQFRDAGKFLGEEISKGYKKSVKIGKGLLGKGNGAGKFNGMLQSQHSAGGFKNLTTAGKIATGTAYAGVAVDSGLQIMQAVKDRHSASKRSKDIGSSIGTAVGGGLATAFLGPEFAPVGAALGKALGGIAGKGVYSFTKGWQSKKPPKKFWSLENLGYSAHNMWKGFTHGVSNVIRWFKKNWKEIGLYFINPIAGAINSLYRHNKKFRNWVNGLVRGFKKAWHSIGRWFGNIGKGIRNAWHSMTSWFSRLGRNMAKGVKSAWRGMTHWFSSIGRGIHRAWSGMVSWFTRLGRNASNGFKSFWRGLSRWFGGIVKNVKGAWHGISSWFGKLAKAAVDLFKKPWNAIVSWFKGIISNIKHAWSGFWSFISGPIHTIEKLSHIHISGHLLSKIHFANGTGPIQEPVVGVLNDGSDSPETGNQEGILHANGLLELLRGRNIPRLLVPGDQVINAHNLASMFGRGIRHFASGTLAFVDYNDLVNDKFDKINKTLAGILDESKKSNKKKHRNYGSVIANALHKASYTTKSGAHVSWNIISESVKKLRTVATKSSKKSKSKKTTKSKKSRKSSSSTSTTRSRVIASVSGASKVNSLKKAIKAVAGSHKVRLSVTTSGSTKGIKSALSSIGNKKAKISLSVKAKNTKSISRLKKNLAKIKNRKAKVTVKAKNTKVISTLKKNLAKIKNHRAKITVTTGNSEKNIRRINSQFSKTTHSIDSDTKRLNRSVTRSWNNTWSKARSSFSSFSSRQRSSLNSFGKSYLKGWKSINSGVKSAQSKAMSDLEDITGKGLNKVINVINSGIGKIDSVIKDFGGNSSAINKVSAVKYASGTGYRPITKPTLAIVNDGFDSPETGNREALYRPATGEFGVFKGRNVPVMLDKGDEILSASETAPFIGGATHFAKGTGWLKHLYELTKKFFNKPTKTLKSMLNFSNDNLKGAIDDLAKGLFKGADKQATKWWEQLWTMVNDKINSGEGPASGLLKAVEELGRGKPYVWGAWGPSAFDCSGLVSRAIQKYYHKGWGRLTVSGLWQHAHKIPRSEAKAGDPVFWLPNDHVGIFDHGDWYWSAFSPHAHPDIGLHRISGSVPGVKPTFGRFDDINDQGKKKDKVEVKANNRLQRFIRPRVGKGFWKTIEKLKEKYGDAGMPNISGNAKAWIGYIKKAARQMHAHVTQTDIDKIVSMINGESGGNARVHQQIKDINSEEGHPAQGLLQFVPQTFDAFAAPGHHKLLNGYDQLLALFNDSNWKNDIHYGGGWGPTGHRRFANGGKILFPQFAEIGEDGPEYVINPAKASADHYLLEAIRDRASQAPQSKIADLSKIIDLDQFKYSKANGWRSQGTAHTEHQVQQVTSNPTQNEGDIHMVVKLDNKTIAHGVEPILDAKQADKIVIAQGGGSI